MKHLSAWISLFASTSTLFCCALPALLVVLGLGASMAGLVGAFPQIVWLSQYKLYVFTFSGIMIGIAAYFQYRARFEPCPTDPRLARLCNRNRKWALGIWFFSAGLWVIGAFFAFFAATLIS